MKQIEFIGRNSIHNLGICIDHYKVKKLFLVAGNNSFHLSGAKDIVQKYIGHIETLQFSDFTENPKLHDVEQGVRLFKAFGPDIVVAIGGGSTIDIAKLINIFAAQEVEPHLILNGFSKYQYTVKPFIAIPTTSGAGSEATHFAVLYVDGVKQSIAHPSVLPEISIIDPQFTYNLSSKQTAISGIDAFCQSIESYWSINSTNDSKNYARSAIELILNNLPDAVHHTNTKNKDAMSIAAHLSGKAINISKTTAPHALSYTMTSRFGVPHGQAVALTLPSFFEFNYNVNKENVADKRGLIYVQETMNELSKMFGINNVENGKNFIIAFIKSVGLSVTLSDLGIKKNNIHEIITTVNSERLKNNPRSISESDLIEIFNKY